VVAKTEPRWTTTWCYNQAGYDMKLNYETEIYIREGNYSCPIVFLRRKACEPINLVSLWKSKMHIVNFWSQCH